MYVFNLKEDNGFVVLSASTLEKPILAYANKGSFDLGSINGHGGVDDWLLTKYLKINGLEATGSPASEGIVQQWNAVGVNIGVGLTDPNGNPIYLEPAVLLSQSAETYGPLLNNIAWNQKNTTSKVMYNNDVRFYGGCTAGTAPVGCVAVAMGQIMKYYNHPNIFNISTMYPFITNNAPFSYTSQPAFDIASFLAHIGASVQMKYNCEFAEAYTQKACDAFNNVYNFTTSGVVGIDLNVVKNNIIAGKPVYLAGYRVMEVVVVSKPLKIFGMSIGKTKTQNSYDEGHAWVTDGYERIVGTYFNPNNNTNFTATMANHLHMNWGWGGSRNGWYDYDSWTDINGIVINSVQFTYNQHMIANITPN